jgi:hypothetical protein
VQEEDQMNAHLGDRQSDESGRETRLIDEMRLRAQNEARVSATASANPMT